MSDYEFPCDKCGMCCRSLNLSNLYDDLHNGSGICKYLNLKTNLCSIYFERPEKCRIVLSYHHFKNVISFENYIEFNKEACKKLKGDI